MELDYWKFCDGARVEWRLLAETQVDNSTGHVITAFEVVADYQESDFAE